jgi:hypothetical protein
LVLACPALGQVSLTGAGPGGMVALAAGATYTGMGDVAAANSVSFKYYFSCQWAISAAYATGTGKLCTIIRASDSETCDILAASTGGEGLTANCSGADNGKTLATFLTATTGKVTKAYNQVTNGTLDVVQATGANQPAVTLSCLSTLTCLSSTANGMQLASTTNSTPSNGTGTFVGYSNRTTGTGISGDVQDNLNGGIGELRRTSGTANSCTLAGSSGTFNKACTDNAWHALLGGAGGASSVLSVDGSEQTGTVTSNTTAGHIVAAIGANSTTSEWIESGLIDGSVVNSTVRAALIANMQARN